jgi:hypothetical protein
VVHGSTDDIVRDADPLIDPRINGQPASKGGNGLWCVDGRIWIPASHLDLHARLCVRAATHS